MGISQSGVLNRGYSNVPQFKQLNKRHLNGLSSANGKSFQKKRIPFGSYKIPNDSSPYVWSPKTTRKASAGSSRYGGSLTVKNSSAQNKDDYSPWYETPFYRKLRGDKPLVFESSTADSSDESTDSDFIRNCAGLETTGPSSNTQSDIEFGEKYLPDMPPTCLPYSSDSKEEVEEEEEVTDNGQVKSTGATYDHIDLLHEEEVTDNGQVKNTWAETCLEDAGPPEHDVAEFNFWDLDVDEST